MPEPNHENRLAHQDAKPPPKRAYKIPPDERRCTATSARTGERCTASRATGRETCSGHAGLGFGKSPEAARQAQQRGWETRRRLRHEAKVRTYLTPRERVATEMASRVDDGRVLAAIDRGLASKDDRLAVQTAQLVLERLLGRPVAVTETQPPGTQAYTELRALVAQLPESERLAYLTQARMAAEVAAHPARALEEGGDQGAAA